MLKLININIDSIDAEVAKNEKCHTNMKAVQGFNTEQEKEGRWKCCINTDSISKSGNNSKKSMAKINLDKPTNYFIAGPTCGNEKRKSAESTQQIHKEFLDVFNDIWCFKGTFSLQLKTNSNPYKALPQHVTYALQKPFQEELLRLQHQDIITPLGVFGIADDILVAGYDIDGKDHDDTVLRVLQRCMEVNLKLNKKMSFQVTSIPFLVR